MATVVRTGSLPSGDVDIFYRRFGSGGAAPLLILHGANYYDSADWIEVGKALASDREVVAYDRRGFGESSWSPTKDYSADAHLGDIVGLLDHLGWDRAVIMGHSLGGVYATMFATFFAGRTAGLILGDSSPGGRPLDTAQSIDNKQKVYATIEDAARDLTREKNVPPGSVQRRRFEEFMEAVEEGYVVGKRDPDFINGVPIAASGWKPKYVISDMWGALSEMKSPILVVQATKSGRYSSDDLARLRQFGHVVLSSVESGHDLAGYAPAAVVDAVRGFLIRHVDEVGVVSLARSAE